MSPWQEAEWDVAGWFCDACDLGVGDDGGGYDRAHAVRAAIAVERERCAKIARSLISSDPDWDSGLWNQACERIALKIETA